MTAVTDVDVAAFYNMSLKDFEHSGVHDLFKVSKFFILLYIYIYISSLSIMQTYVLIWF